MVKDGSVLNNSQSVISALDTGKVEICPDIEVATTAKPSQEDDKSSILSQHEIPDHLKHTADIPNGDRALRMEWKVGMDELVDGTSTSKGVERESRLLEEIRTLRSEVSVLKGNLQESENRRVKMEAKLRRMEWCDGKSSLANVMSLGCTRAL